MLFLSFSSLRARRFLLHSPVYTFHFSLTHMGLLYGARLGLFGEFPFYISRSPYQDVFDETGLATITAIIAFGLSIHTNVAGNNLDSFLKGAFNDVFKGSLSFAQLGIATGVFTLIVVPFLCVHSSRGVSSHYGYGTHLPPLEGSWPTVQSSAQYGL